MPPYWKRGLVAGVSIGFIMTFLSHRIDPQLGADATAAAQHGTPIGPLMGVIVFALFCVMPGPDPK